MSLKKVSQTVKSSSFSRLTLYVLRLLDQLLRSFFPCVCVFTENGEAILKYELDNFSVWLTGWLAGWLDQTPHSQQEQSQSLRPPTPSFLQCPPKPHPNHHHHHHHQKSMSRKHQDAIDKVDMRWANLSSHLKQKENNSQRERERMEAAILLLLCSGRRFRRCVAGGGIDAVVMRSARCFALLSGERPASWPAIGRVVAIAENDHQRPFPASCPPTADGRGS